MKKICQILFIIIILLNFCIKDCYAKEQNEQDNFLVINNGLTGDLVTVKDNLKKISKEYWEEGNVAAVKVDVTKKEDGTYWIGSGNNMIEWPKYRAEFLGAEDKENVDTWEVWLEVEYDTYTDGKFAAYVKKSIYDEQYNPEVDAWGDTRALNKVAEETADKVADAADAIGDFFGDTFGKLVNFLKGVYDLVTGGLGKIFRDILQKLLIWLLDALRTIADAIQMLVNSLQTASDGTYEDWKITYPEETLRKEGEKGKRNKYTNVKKGYTEDDGNIPINVDIEGFGKDEDTFKYPEIPVIPVDLYNIALGNVSVLDVNFLSPDVEKHKDDGAWMKIRNFAVSVIRISIFVASACLLTTLIWSGTRLVGSTLTPDERREHMQILERFGTSLVMLIGTVVIMALGIYASDMFLGKVKKEYGDELPIRVNVKEAKYGFSTNPIGYVRYMTQINSEDSLQTKAIYTFGYFILAEINFLAALLMLVRMLVMLVLSVVGPIIAVLHVLNLDDNLSVSYRDWVNWYLSWAAIQVVLAMFYRVILETVV